jgi:hypothetical protein
MVAEMRDLRNRHFFIPPLNEENLLELGLSVPDTTRTPHVNVTEEVDFVLEIQGIRQVHVRFWVKGKSSMAKLIRGVLPKAKLQAIRRSRIAGPWSDIKSTIIP